MGIFLRDPRSLALKILAQLLGKRIFHFACLFYFLHLMPQKSDVRRELAAKRFCLVDIDSRLIEFALALCLFVLVKLQAERVLHHLAPLFGRRVQYSICLALRYYLVAGAADVRAREEPNNVFQTYLRPIQQVFILSVAVHDAFHNDLLEIDIEKTGRIVENDFHRAARDARKSRASTPNEIFAAL